MYAGLKPSMAGETINLATQGNQAALSDHSTGLTVETDAHNAASATDTAASPAEVEQGRKFADGGDLGGLGQIGLHNTSQPKTQSFQRSSLASAGTTHAAFGTTREQLSNASGQCADISTRTHPPEPVRRETPLKAAGHLGSRKQIAKKRINYKDLIGRDIEIPADVFDVQVPGLLFTARVTRKDTGHPGSVVIRFKEDGSSFWLPADEVWRYVREAEARSLKSQPTGFDACAESAAEVLCCMSGSSARPDGNSTSAATPEADNNLSGSSGNLGASAASNIKKSANQQATSALSLIDHQMLSVATRSPALGPILASSLQQAAAKKPRSISRSHLN